MKTIRSWVTIRLAPAGYLWLLPALVLSAPTVRANSNLDKCALADSEFDYQKVLTECVVAAQDMALTAEQNLEIYRLLGTAHTALGDEESAAVWFTRLLVLDANYVFPEDASPVYIKAFMNAKIQFAESGIIQVSHSPPTLNDQFWPAGGTVPVRYTITDKLGQVQSVIVNVQAVVGDQVLRQIEIALKRNPTETPGEVVFDGDLTNPAATLQGTKPSEYTVRYELKLRNQVGTILEPSPKAEIVSLPVIRSDAESDEGGGGLLWAGVGAGLVAAAGAAALAGAGTGVGLYCYLSGTCLNSSPPLAPRSEVQVTTGAVSHGN